MARRHVRALNVAEIAPAQHPEEAPLSPLLVPAVCHQPIRRGCTRALGVLGWVRLIASTHGLGAVVRMRQQAIREAPIVGHGGINRMADVMRITISALAPANDFHCVPTHEGTGVSGCVHAPSIELPILVHVKSGRDGAISHDLCLHLCHALDHVSRRGAMLVCRIRCDVARLCALAGASRQLATAWAIQWRAHLIRLAGFVVVAEAKLVRLAGGALALVRFIATRHDTSRGQPLPRGIRIAATAAELSRSVRQSVPRREDHIVLACGDAESIIESRGGAKGPTGAAIRLVTNPTDDRCALGSLLPSVEALWDARCHLQRRIWQARVRDIDGSVMPWLVPVQKGASIAGIRAESKGNSERATGHTI